jgi:hypothetical protein
MDSEPLDAFMTLDVVFGHGTCGFFICRFDKQHMLAMLSVWAGLPDHAEFEVIMLHGSTKGEGEWQSRQRS